MDGMARRVPVHKSTSNFFRQPVEDDDLDEMSDEQAEESSCDPPDDGSPCTKKQRRSTVRNEYELDEGRIAGQDFLQKVRVAVSNKKVAKKQISDFQKAFKANVHASGIELMRMIDENQAILTTRDANFLDTFRSLYGMGILNNNTGHLDEKINLKKDAFTVDIREESTQSLINAYKLINEFEEFDKKITDERNTLPLGASDDDLDGIQSTLDAGREVGEKKIEFLLRGTVHNIDGEIEEAFYKRQKDETTWAMVARHEQKIMGKAARMVQKETEA